MEVPRHASAFCQSFIEAGADGSCNLPHSEPVENDHDENTGHGAETSKPGCLIPGGRDTEIQDCAYFVPDPAVVARDDPKSVSPWPEVTIESLTPRSWFLPGCVVAFQFVTKTHFLWD